MNRRSLFKSLFAGVAIAKSGALEKKEEVEAIPKEVPVPHRPIPSQGFIQDYGVDKPLHWGMTGVTSFKEEFPLTCHRCRETFYSNEYHMVCPDCTEEIARVLTPREAK